MRVRRPLALGALVIIALGGMIGLAAFSTDAPSVPTTTIEAELPAEARGRVAAAAFAAVLRGEVADPFDAASDDPSESIASIESAPATTTTTTVSPTAPAVQESSATTAAPTTTTTAAPTTTTTTTPPPVPGGPRDVEEWRPLTEQYFPAELVEDALWVIECESRGDPTARNPASGAAGLFQFISSTWRWASSEAGWAGADVYDPEANIAVAAWLVQQSIDTNHPGGPWGHWSCKP
jgi:soluble lytic murein transglycosylase-like protein